MGNFLRTDRGVFDPLGQGSGTSVTKISVPSLEPNPEDNPEIAINNLEKKVNSLLEESADASVKGNYTLVSYMYMYIHVYPCRYMYMYMYCM